MKINVDVPDGVSGDWEVSTFAIDRDGAAAHNLRCAIQPRLNGREVQVGEYKKLTRNGETIMSNTRAETIDHLEFLGNVALYGGDILINGLGLGVALTEILQGDDVKSVTVIENSADVIALVAPTFEKDPRVTIIHADALEWKPPKGKKYTVVWHDIWDNICANNLPDMHKLHRKYGRRAEWQDSWCRYLCEAAA